MLCAFFWAIPRRLNFVFYRPMNKCIDTIISQNTTQFYAQYVEYISQLHVSAHLGHFQVPYTLAIVVA